MRIHGSKSHESINTLTKLLKNTKLFSGNDNFIKINYSSIGLTAGYDSPFGQIKLNYSHALNKNPGIFSVVLGHWF